MHEPEYVSRLIGDIYDAALDPALWPPVLKAASEYVPGASGTLMSQDSLSGSAQFYFQWGNDPSFLKSYQDVYVKLNPVLVPALLHAKVGDICSTVDFLPLDEFFASRFYKEWVAPQGLVDSVFCTLDTSATSYAFIAITRHERHGVVDGKTRRRMGLLGPHFRRAIAIGKLIDLHKVEAAALADSLDCLAAAMFLVDSGGRIVHANAAGQVMLREGSVIRTAGGKFAAVHREANRALHDIFMNAASGDAAIGTRGIAVQIPSSDGTRYVADVLPLTSGRRRSAVAAYSAVAAVFVRKAAFEPPHQLDTIASTFKLTPAEMRVSMMIVEIGGVPQIARALGVSETTIKTHLQHIFAKTGTSRQADLVKLIAGYMSLLRD
ncbi:MAG TPA: helix-turn-helix transcriptional regulator [Alphaproteobacteria bacterium]|jgi:DNA-binding CsgD family transcriptional regulator